MHRCQLSQRNGSTRSENTYKKEMNEYKSLTGKDETPTIRGGGRNSLTIKHNWDFIVIKQINNSKESGGQQPYQQDRIYDVSGEMSCLSKGNGGNIVPKILIKSNTNKGFEEAKEGDTINYTQPNSKTRRGRVGVAQTLDTQVNQATIIEGNIRRLTEVECERLQGFPDNWTKYGSYDGVVKEISRTQRYKLIGNAVTTDIVNLIGQKLIAKI